MVTRNSEALESFTAYCKANPKQRFWQALRNWSKYHTIYGYNGPHPLEDEISDESLVSLEDTFYLEGLAGIDAAK